MVECFSWIGSLSFFVSFPIPNREGQEIKDDETLKAMSPLKLVTIEACASVESARNPCQLWKQSVV
jgi:hypothetical protein